MIMSSTPPPTFRYITMVSVPGEPLEYCDACGAIVTSNSKWKHEEFHQNIDRAMELANALLGQAESEAEDAYDELEGVRCDLSEAQSQVNQLTQEMEQLRAEHATQIAMLKDDSNNDPDYLRAKLAIVLTPEVTGE